MNAENRPSNSRCERSSPVLRSSSRRWAVRALALSILILAAVVPNPAQAQADCRLDWNGDGAINDRDLYHYDANKPDDQCGLSGFYSEWYLYTGYPENYALCFPEADPARLDYNHDGALDLSDIGLFSGHVSHSH